MAEKLCELKKSSSGGSLSPDYVLSCLPTEIDVRLYTYKGDANPSCDDTWSMNAIVDCIITITQRSNANCSITNVTTNTKINTVSATLSCSQGDQIKFQAYNSRSSAGTGHTYLKWSWSLPT